jgi:ABC-type bacteriocin/lantibiotic exporter with double-glycine peptidase domain
MICLSGSSGSGKSSVLRLLTGAFTNFTGTILIDNAPVGNYSLKSLRSQTGILLSQQDIFNGTLLENLTMGSADISIDEVNKLSDKLNLKDFIKTYKDGYDAILDTQGKKINANIRQEILLVRALVGNHRLLLLENPFNNLEPKEIVALLDYLQKENTATIIITSDDENVKSKCDMIINLK